MILGFKLLMFCRVSKLIIVDVRGPAEVSGASCVPEVVKASLRSAVVRASPCRPVAIACYQSSRLFVVGAASQSMSVAVASYMLSVEGYPYVSGLCQSVCKSVCPLLLS